MTIDEQIGELNLEVKCHIKPSSIHGIGVFALRDIKQGEKLYLIPNKTRKWYSIPFEQLYGLRPEIKEVVLARWPSIILGSMFISPNDMDWLVTFVNHSCNNFNYYQDDDCATRDIECGEEILERYCQMKRYKEVFPWLSCSC